MTKRSKPNSSFKLLMKILAVAVLSCLTTIGVIAYSIDSSDDNTISYDTVVLGGMKPSTTDEPIEPLDEPVEPTPIPEEEPKVVYFNVPLSHDLQDYIRGLCEEYDVPMELVLAMIEKESSFNPNAVSKTNDYGLMQINGIHHETMRKKFGITDYLDPCSNVLYGIYLISGHLSKTDGNIELALMRYNAGAAGAKRLWDAGIYSTSYSRSIKALYESYKTGRKG